MDSKNRLFRKSRFGGFNRDDVIDYIETMKNEFYEYKTDVEETIKSLNDRIEELEKENLRLLDSIDEREIEYNEFEENYPVDGINEATDHLKMVADELCDSLCRFLDKLNDNSFTVTVEAPVSRAENETGVSGILNSVFSDKTAKKTTEDSSKESILDSVLPSYLFE